MKYHRREVLFFLAPLVLTGCAGTMQQNLKKQQLQDATAAVTAVFAANQANFALTGAGFAGAPISKVSNDTSMLLENDKKEPKINFAPAASEDQIVVSKFLDPRTFNSLKVIDPGTVQLAFPKRSAIEHYKDYITALFLKDLKTGSYAYLTPEGASVDSWKVSADGKFLVYYISQYGLYLQPLAALKPRNLLTPGTGISATAIAAEAALNARYVSTGKMRLDTPLAAAVPAYQFSPGGKYLAYTVPAKGLFLLSLQKPGDAAKLVVSTDTCNRMVFNNSENFLYCEGNDGLLYDIAAGGEVMIPVDKLSLEMEKGVGMMKGLGRLLGGQTDVEGVNRSFELSDISSDGRYAMFMIGALLTSQSSNQSSVYSLYTTVTTRRSWTPEKNVILDMKTGEVRRLFGAKAYGDPILHPYFLPDGRIVYDGAVSVDSKIDLEEFAIYDMRPLSKIFETPENQFKKLVKSSSIKFGKGIKAKGECEASLSADGNHLVWGKNYARLPAGGVREIPCIYCCRTTTTAGALWNSRPMVFSPDAKFLYYFGKNREVLRTSIE